MSIQRKIVNVGYSRITVLPKYWIEQQGFMKGDKITMIITKSGNLVLLGKKNET